MASKQGPGPFSVIPDTAQTHALLNSPLEDFSSLQSGLLPSLVLSRHTLEGSPPRVFSRAHAMCPPLLCGIAPRLPVAHRTKTLAHLAVCSLASLPLTTSLPLLLTMHPSFRATMLLS